jgi:putative Holliday junction resolvase
MGNQTVLGFDFGMKRIGVAVGQTVTRTASPLTVLSAKQGEPEWVEVDKIIKNWRPSALIVGRPLQMDGSIQRLTTAADHFTQLLQTRYALTVYQVDERLSSKAARADIFDGGGYRALRKRPVDSAAAQIILQDWLNNQ